MILEYDHGRETNAKMRIIFDDFVMRNKQQKSKTNLLQMTFLIHRHFHEHSYNDLILPHHWLRKNSRHYFPRYNLHHWLMIAWHQILNRHWKYHLHVNVNYGSLTMECHWYLAWFENASETKKKKHYVSIGKKTFSVSGHTCRLIELFFRLTIIVGPESIVFACCSSERGIACSCSRWRLCLLPIRFNESWFCTTWSSSG